MKLTIFFTLIIYSSISFAETTGCDAFLINKLNFCKITKEDNSNNYEPENFETTNNLLRETGQGSLYCGEKIIISGTVVDQNCVPISDAKVYIWQTDCKGKYPYIPLKTSVNKKLIDIRQNLTFTGNGVATTNNNGEFHFLTLYPASIHNMASHVNVRIEHRTVGTLQTNLVLKNHKIENAEYYPELKSIYETASKNNISIYNYQIVLPGRSENNY